MGVQTVFLRFGSSSSVMGDWWRGGLHLAMLLWLTIAVLGCRNTVGDCRLVTPQGLSAGELADQFGELSGSVSLPDGRAVSGASVELTPWPGLYGGPGGSDSCEVIGTSSSDTDGSWQHDAWQHDDEPQRLIPAGPMRARVTGDGLVPRFAHRWLSVDDEWPITVLPDDAGDVELLPDMIVDASVMTDCVVLQTTELRQLRVSVGTANVGFGALELRSVLDDAVVRQAIFNADGTEREQILDDVSFEWVDHEDHDHFHFTGWTSLQLLDLDMQPVGEGRKVSFCIADSTLFDTAMTLDDGWTGPRYDCELTSGTLTQGIAPGFQDVYTRSTEGQFIDVQGVPGGEYWLEVTVDPDGRIVESDTTNNSARVRVHLPDGASTGQNVCEMDPA